VFVLAEIPRIPVTQFYQTTANRPSRYAIITKNSDHLGEQADYTEPQTQNSGFQSTFIVPACRSISFITLSGR